MNAFVTGAGRGIGPVAGILRVLDAATLERSGEFLDFKGGNYPW